MRAGRCPCPHVAMHAHMGADCSMTPRHSRRLQGAAQRAAILCDRDVRRDALLLADFASGTGSDRSHVRRGR